METHFISCKATKQNRNRMHKQWFHFNMNYAPQKYQKYQTSNCKDETEGGKPKNQNTKKNIGI